VPSPWRLQWLVPKVIVTTCFRLDSTACRCWLVKWALSSSHPMRTPGHEASGTLLRNSGRLRPSRLTAQTGPGWTIPWHIVFDHPHPIGRDAIALGDGVFCCRQK
jgi:hypothetical protein